MTPTYKILNGDVREKIKELDDNSVDAVVCDPPYSLVSIVERFGKEGSAPAKHGKDGAFARASKGFMGQEWDGTFIERDVNMWKEVLRVLKPGGHLLAFGGTRTSHRMACAIEDAGFEIRDSAVWLYGSGLPKSQNLALMLDKKDGKIGNRGKRINMSGDAGYHNEKVSTAVSKKQGNLLPPYESDNKLNGYGTALKPAHEPIVLARKPLSEKTILANVLKWGTGALNIDGCRVDTKPNTQGRFPANVILGDSKDVRQILPNGAWRYFYCAKASAQDRNEGLERFEKKPAQNIYPTVKPTDLMRYLVRLVAPPENPVVLDCFMGSGSTGKACMLEGVSFIGIEQSKEYCAIAEARIQHAQEVYKAQAAQQKLDL